MTTTTDPGRSPGGLLRSAGTRPLPCPGQANALRAIGLLSRWNRAIRLQAMFMGPCACCAGDVQTAHMERQVVEHLYERHRSNPVLEELLGACRGAPDERGAVGEMMRLIATERSAENAAQHGALLADFESVVQSLE